MSEMDLDHIDFSDDLRARGRRTQSVVSAPTPAGPFAAPVSPSISQWPVSVAEVAPLPPPPLPQPECQSHPRTNTCEQAAESPLPSGFKQKRQEFVRLFNSNHWNRPADQLDGLGPELQQSKALVIAIHYGDRDPLPATYVDAYNILTMLEDQFAYLPKTIRVLADRVGKSQAKDGRWPNKKNILKSLQWLNEGSVPGSRRFLFFAGHGYSLNLKQDGKYYTHEGILPRDFLTFPPYQEDEDDAPARDVPDPKTVLFDDELNRCLVKGLADGAKLTVIFDCCHSGGLTILVPKFEDMSHIRHRHFFNGQIIRSRGDDSDSPLGSSLHGNLLGLPLKVVLANSSTEESLDRSKMDDDSEEDEVASGKLINLDFEPFPENCEVVSWSACERGQLAREDSEGGRFTNAFVAGMGSAPNTASEVTYRELNRCIQSLFDEHNKGIGTSDTNKVRGGAEPGTQNAVRASVNENVEQLETQTQKYQYPKLHVSANIAKTFADKPVKI